MAPFRFQLLHRAAQKNTTVLHALERSRLGVELGDAVVEGRVVLDPHFVIVA